MLRSWTDDAWADYLYWQREDKRALKKINQLVEDIVRNGNVGLGSPEPLKHEFSGLWSRRITQEHRLVYRVDKEQVLIFACRCHYELT